MRLQQNSGGAAQRRGGGVWHFRHLGRRRGSTGLEEDVRMANVPAGACVGEVRILVRAWRYASFHRERFSVSIDKRPRYKQEEGEEGVMSPQATAFGEFSLCFRWRWERATVYACCSCCLAQFARTTR